MFDAPTPANAPDILKPERTTMAGTKNPTRPGKAATSKSKPDATGDRPADKSTTSGTLALAMFDPYLRHAVAAKAMAKSGLGDAWKGVDVWDYATELRKRGRTAETGNLSEVTHILTAQALTLDAIFTEFARRSIHNVDGYLEASERMMRLALKAQAGSRATLEALAKLHQPKEQTVRHVHVNEGGQAVIADQFHHHAGGHTNAETVIQPHEPDSAAGAGPALPSPDTFGNGVPVPGDEGQEAVPAARGEKPRRA